jgi:hypothetical protein
LDGDAVNAAEVVLVYVCIPGAVTGTVASLVFLPGLTRRPKYRPGEPWPHEPVFYGPHVEMLDEELQDVLTGRESEVPALVAQPRPMLTAGPQATAPEPEPAPQPRPVSAARGGAHGDW